MRKFFSTVVLTLSFLFLLADNHAGPGLVAFYNGSFEQMKVQAYQDQKPYLISFHDNGQPSRNLERFTYANPNLAAFVANNFLAIKFTYEQEDSVGEALMDRYQILFFPTVVLFSSEGNLLYRFTGFTSESAFIEMLRAYQYEHSTDMSQAYPPESIALPYSLPAPVELEVPPISAETEKIVEDNWETDQIVIWDQTETIDKKVEELTEEQKPENTVIQTGETYTTLAWLEPDPESTDQEPEQVNFVAGTTFRLEDKPEVEANQEPVEVIAGTSFQLEDNYLETTEIDADPEPEIVPEPEPKPQSNKLVQTGVYAEYNNAISEKRRLESAYQQEVVIEVIERNGQDLFRVTVGPFDADENAVEFLNMYNEKERYDAILKRRF